MANHCWQRRLLKKFKPPVSKIVKLGNLLVLLSIACLSACAVEQASIQSSQIATEAPQVQPTVEAEVEVLQPVEALPAPIPVSRDAADWKDWPVIPSLEPEMLEVYALGQELGRNAQVVSVVGDCESSSDWFLKDFARGERFYRLGSYKGLQATIDYFSPSLGYTSHAAIRGATASTVLTSLWADRKACEKNETPLGCEYRLHDPAFAFIALGTNDVHKREQFAPKMRQIIEYTLKQGIVPILVTKADNIEGDESINLTIAQLAVEYHVPVWNFWAAVQSLPDHGLQPDGAHLTFASNHFDDPEKLQHAWPVRNLTALQVLEVMRLAAQEN